MPGQSIIECGEAFLKKIDAVYRSSETSILHMPIFKHRHISLKDIILCKKGEGVEAGWRWKTVNRIQLSGFLHP